MRVVLALLLLSGPARPDQADFRFPAQVEGDVRAWLEVEVADARTLPGMAAVTLTIHVEGGPDLETQPVQLSDTTGDWKVHGRCSAWTNAARTSVSETILLRQRKPGPASLPAVTVRFRSRSDAEWARAHWSNILGQEEDVAPPEGETRTPAPWLGWLPIAAVPATALLLMVVLRKWLRRPRPVPPLSPEQRAWQALALLEQQGVPPEHSWAAQHTQLSDVIRRYLAERLGVPALEQSSSELLAALSSRLPAESTLTPLLAQLLHHCDRAKFAPGAGSAESWQQTVQRARDFLTAAASLPPQL